MKKLVLKTFQNLQIEEAPIPIPSTEQAVVCIRYAGICGSDLHVLDGLHPSAKVPLVMGHEACGQICALNSSRTDIKVGDKVCFHTVSPCNCCKACVSGRENLCRHIRIMGTNFDGVFTQYMLVDANRLIRLADQVNDQIATLVEPLTVAIHDIRRADFQPGNSVFISGAGPIGLLIAIVARFSGASCVALSEINPIRIRIAQDMGFLVIDPNSAEFDKTCQEAVDGAGFDKAFEITSIQSGFSTCIRQLKKGGVAIQVGMPPARTELMLDINKIIYSECDLRGVRHHTMQDMMIAAQLINTGILNQQLIPFISAIYPLKDYAEAFQRARNDKSMLRVILDFQDD